MIVLTGPVRPFRAPVRPFRKPVGRLRGRLSGASSSQPPPFAAVKTPRTTPSSFLASAPLDMYYSTLTHSPRFRPVTEVLFGNAVRETPVSHEVPRLDAKQEFRGVRSRTGVRERGNQGKPRFRSPALIFPHRRPFSPAQIPPRHGTNISFARPRRAPRSVHDALHPARGPLRPGPGRAHPLALGAVPGYNIKAQRQRRAGWG